MTGRLDVERALDALLAPDHDRLADRVLDAALDQVADTQQARRGLNAPWRFFPMNTFARGAAVVVAVLVAVGALVLLSGPKGGIGGPGPSPSAEPTAPPLPSLDATFTSSSYGYQIHYPTGWTVAHGRGAWPLNVTLGPGDPVMDGIVASRPIDRVRISAASIALPSGMSMEDFRAFASPYSAPFQNDPCPALAPLSLPLTLSYQASAGGSTQAVPAVVSINGCNALAELGGHVYDIEAIAGGRGYEFIIDGHISTADAVAWLSTITLQPATAPVPSAAPSASPSVAPSPSASN